MVSVDAVPKDSDKRVISVTPWACVAATPVPCHSADVTTVAAMCETAIRPALPIRGTSTKSCHGPTQRQRQARTSPPETGAKFVAASTLKDTWIAELRLPATLRDVQVGPSFASHASPLQKTRAKTSVPPS